LLLKNVFQKVEVIQLTRFNWLWKFKKISKN